MAYQNVGTPRFYVNVVEWLISNNVFIAGGTDPSSNVVLNTLPVNPTSHGDFNLSGLVGMTSNGFVATLGHTFHSTTTNYRMYEAQGEGSYNSSSAKTWYNVVNSSDNATENNPPNDGFSISTFEGTNNLYFWIEEAKETGSIVIGTYYDMPNAPNLSLTMSREYGGTKEFTTYNGGSMSNTMWSKTPKWGDLGAWELGGYPALAKSGRRSWDLKFSYMDDGDLWGSNQSLSRAVGDTLSASDIALYDGGIGYDLGNTTTFNYNLLTDYNFFSQVWHKTLGGTLPFIFQPDSSNNSNPDQFAICRFKDNSLKATQSALNLYDISLSIEEVW